MNTNKQKFLNTLKYGKDHVEMSLKLNEFKEFIIEQKNGTASINYNDITKHFIITTYRSYWEIEKFTPPNNLNLYRNAKQLFLPFIKNIINNNFHWAIDETGGNGIIKYYVWI